MFLVAQVPSTLLQDRFCDPLPEPRGGRCSPLRPGTNFSFLSDLRVPLVPQPQGTTAQISVAKFAQTLVLAHGHSDPVPPTPPPRA